MSGATIDDLRTLLEAQMASSDRRREEDLRWRGGIEGTLRNVSDEVGKLRSRQDNFDAELKRTAEKARVAQTSAHDIDSKVTGTLDGFSKHFTERLTAQDKAIAALNTETSEQTKTLADIREYQIKFTAQAGLLSKLLPGVVVLCSALWWLFSHMH